MSLSAWWAQAIWPVRTAASVWWSMVNRRDMVPVPAANTVKEVATGAAVLAANYRPDPVNGLLDFSIDPRQVQCHLERGTLGLLPSLDCDDLAYWACARLREIAGPPGGATNHVLVLSDETGRYSHAVCEAWVDGVHLVIDTNGCHNLAGWPSVSVFMTSIYPAARYKGEFRADYPFPDPARA